MSRLARFLDDYLPAQRFWGKVTVEFEDGKLMTPIVVTQAYREDALPTRPRRPEDAMPAP